jgi:hypothetical protein
VFALKQVGDPGWCGTQQCWASGQSRISSGWHRTSSSSSSLHATSTVCQRAAPLRRTDSIRIDVQRVIRWPEPGDAQSAHNQRDPRYLATQCRFGCWKKRSKRCRQPEMGDPKRATRNRLRLRGASARRRLSCSPSVNTKDAKVRPSSFPGGRCALCVDTQGQGEDPATLAPLSRVYR